MFPNTEEGNEIWYKVVNNCLIRFGEEDADHDGNSNLYYDVLLLGNKNSVIPDGLRHIGDYACMGSSIKEVHFPDTLRGIGYKAFYDCDKLKTVAIRERIGAVEDLAFGECDGIESILLCGDVVLGGPSQYFTSGAFMNCPNLKTVYYMGTENNISVEFRGTDETVQNATWYFYSATEPEVRGKYWRFKDGIPTLW
jgi:hypothetical protein